MRMKKNNSNDKKTLIINKNKIDSAKKKAKTIKNKAKSGVIKAKDKTVDLTKNVSITIKNKVKDIKVKQEDKITKKNNNLVENSNKKNYKKNLKQIDNKKSKKKKKKKRTISKIILEIILALIIICILFFIGCFAYIIYNAPKFDPKNLQRQNGTLVYDKNNTLVAVIGLEKRQKVTYEELPEVLIDAIISTEDAKFFQHNGIDVPRFIKASFSHIQGEDAGGASTITMQLSKNSFTSTEAKGIKGIIRKLTDVYLSVFHIEKEYTKEELMEFYVNSPYLGGSSYGVEQASQTYFNKSVSDLSLVEAATLAGLFQSPSAYDPFSYPDKIEARKNQVLGLMKRHEYIDEATYNDAVKVKVSSLLSDARKKSNTKYQGFVDTVVQEVIDTTGNNPYEVPMAIYTTLDTGKQNAINEFYKTHEFKDDKVEAGIGVIDNKTGEVLAVGAGRNKTKEMTYNYATQIKRHPGSTAKPLFDYAPGIEFEKWSTYKSFYDKPVKYTNGGVLKNWDKKYKGYMTLKDCLVQSRNTCALQAFQQLDNKKVIEFVQKLGIKPEINNGYIGEWHSIGAFNGVNPVQLAGAYSAFGNEGNFVKPHSYKKIVYFNTGKEYKPDYKAVKAMSPETAYMISWMLKDVTDNSVAVEGTDIATKTGTSSYDENLTEALGLSSDVIQDSWTVTFSPDFTVAIWFGYDKLTSTNYNTMNYASLERVRMQSEIVNKIMKPNSTFKQPDSVVERYMGYNNLHLFVKGSEPY